MTLPELYRSIRAAIQNPAAHDLEQLKVHAQQIADMTTWAPAMIDPNGQASAISLELEQQLRAIYAETQNQSVAELHDALCEVRGAIAQHDDDLRPRREDDEDGGG